MVITALPMDAAPFALKMLTATMRAPLGVNVGMPFSSMT